MSYIDKIKKALLLAYISDVGCELQNAECNDITKYIAELEGELNRYKLAMEQDLSDSKAKSQNFISAINRKNSYQQQLEQLCHKRWLALHEICTEGKKRGVDWCVEKAREGEA